MGDLEDRILVNGRSQREYRGWAPGASDDEEISFNSSRQPPTAFAEQVRRREEYLRDRTRLRRLRDHFDARVTERTSNHQDLEFQEQEPPQGQSRFVETGVGGSHLASESSLRTTALLQAVRRNSQFSAHSRNQLQRYILDRERIGNDTEEGDRATTAPRWTAPSTANLSPSQRRQLYREATVRQEIQQHRDQLSEFQQHRSYLEEQLRRQRHGGVPQLDNRTRRYWQTPSPSPPSDKRSIDNAIKYIERLRLCESEQEGLETAEEGGFDPDEFCPQNRQDFLIDTTLIPPPPESSWLKVGGVLSGTQHAGSSSLLPTYTPLMPPSQYRSRIRHPTFGATTARTTSPVQANSRTPSSGRPSEHPIAFKEERWPVKVTIQSIDYLTMTLSGTMEAFNVPDKSSPTKESSIKTFLQGEIIDFNNCTLETKNFKSEPRIDGTYWRKLPPFKDLKDDDAMVKNLLSNGWLRKELMEKWILMRWKGISSQPLLTASLSLKLTPLTEKCFITPSDAQSSLTISGFYYVSLRREDGHVEGLYYDPSSTPYQHLSLKPDRRYFPAYSFQ